MWYIDRLKSFIVQQNYTNTKDIVEHLNTKLTNILSILVVL